MAKCKSKNKGKNAAAAGVNTNTASGSTEKAKTLRKLKPWCWYCDREFEDDKVLIQHQRMKHFKCSFCHRKLNSASGLLIHLAQVHKSTIDRVPNAIDGHDSPELEIFGMDGVPAGDLQRHQSGLPPAPYNPRSRLVVGDAGSLLPLLAAQKVQVAAQLAESKSKIIGSDVPMAHSAMASRPTNAVANVSNGVGTIPSLAAPSPSMPTYSVSASMSGSAFPYAPPLGAYNQQPHPYAAYYAQYGAAAYYGGYYPHPNQVQPPHPYQMQAGGQAYPYSVVNGGQGQVQVPMPAPVPAQELSQEQEPSQGPSVEASASDQQQVENKE